MRRILPCFLAMFLTCGPVAAGGFSGKAVAGDTTVTWQTVTGSVARHSGIANHLSLMAFTFDRGAGSTVSEEKWPAEAARHGVDVRTLKIMLGSQVYVTGDGRLATCTMVAIRKGLCPAPGSLPIQNRARIAQSILEQSGTCRWTGFDPALHDRMARQNAGAPEATLWVAADC